MVPLDMALVSSYRLSIVTMSLTAAVWPQFAMQSFHLHVCFWKHFLTYLVFTDAGSSMILNIKLANKTLNVATGICR